MLRKAGEMLRSFDDAYAKKIAQMYLPEDLTAGQGGIPRAVAAIAGGGLPARIMPEEGPMAIRAGLPAVSTAVRYGAPVAGVAIAARGISDLTAALSGQQTVESVMPQ